MPVRLPQSFAQKEFKQFAPARTHRLFGCLPLEQGVTLYVLFIVAVQIFALFWTVIYGGAVGGWAILMTKLSEGKGLMIAETITYGFSIIAAVYALAGIISFHDGEDYLQARGVYTEVANEVLAVKKRSAFALLVFHIINAARFCLFVPITGLALAWTNTCGVHVAMLRSVDLPQAEAAGTTLALNCSLGDAFGIVSVVAFFVLDAYFLCATFMLWGHFRSEGAVESTSYDRSFEEPEKVVLTDTSFSYGAFLDDDVQEVL